MMDDSKIEIRENLMIGIQGRFESGLIAVHPKDVPTISMKNKIPPAIAIYSTGKEVVAGSRQIKDVQKEF